MKYKFPILLSLAWASTLAIQSAAAAPSIFQPYVTFPISEMGLAVGIGDFNSDGLNDVAVVSANPELTINNLTIKLQSADGTLGTPMVYSTGTYPVSLATGDVNNDGRSDIVTANLGSSNIGVFLQQGDGFMASHTLYATGSTPDAVAIGDINNDGLDDVAVAHRGSSFIGVFTQNVDGTLNEMVTYTSPLIGYGDIEIADVNNDGRSDIVKMNGRNWNATFYVYLQNPAGTLDLPQSYSVENCSSSCYGHAIETGDVTGDGLTDIVLAYGVDPTTSQLAMFRQASDGSLLPSISYDTYNRPETLVIADVNLDGQADVITAHGGESQVGVALQMNGTLDPYLLYPVPYTVLYEHQNLEAGDINNDGATDIILTSYFNGLVVLYHTLPDLTPPVIVATAVNADDTPYTPGTWTNQTVTVKYSCTDNESGIASCPADQVFSADSINSVTTGTATDNAGNSASADFGPIQIDNTPPSLSIEISPNPVLLNGSASLIDNAYDELSGVSSVACSTIDTATVGEKTITCQATDNAGNVATASTDHQVIYDFVGFLNPVVDCVNNLCDSYTLSVVNPGSTVPVKFQLKDANGITVKAVNAPLWLVPTNFEPGSPIALPEGYEFQVSDTPYEWKKNHSIYVYDWGTRGLPNNSVWLIGVRLDDGLTYYVFVALLK